jgi:hypothetical protein
MKRYAEKIYDEECQKVRGGNAFHLTGNSATKDGIVSDTGNKGTGVHSKGERVLEKVPF